MKNLIGFSFLVLLVGLFSCGEEVGCCLPPPVEAFENVPAQGCASFYVYKEDETALLHLAVQGNREALELDDKNKTFDLTEGLVKVELLKFNDEIGNYACDDVANDQGEIADTWIATEGFAFIKIEEDSITVSEWELTYKITVVLKDVVLENSDKDETRFDRVVFGNVLVGWLPG